MEENKVATVMLINCMPASESSPLTIKDEMQMMLLRLGSSQMVAQKLGGDKGIDSS